MLFYGGAILFAPFSESPRGVIAAIFLGPSDCGLWLCWIPMTTLAETVAALAMLGGRG
jgi:hypothetical protein